MADPFSPAETTAVVFLAGFAIQQVLQILDPFVVWGMAKLKAGRPNKDLPGGMADADFKKAVMAALAFVLGLATALMTGIRLLRLVRPEFNDFGDLLVSALVLGTGTEAVNTVLKFISYVKDAQKPPPEPEVSVSPSAVSLKQGTTFQFRATAKNAGQAVTWRVLHGAGGMITPAGLYTAPAAAGVFQVSAELAADPTKFAAATVTVTA